MSPEFQAQLSAAAQERTKSELQEQLQFPMTDVIDTTEDDLQAEFVNVAYNEEPDVGVSFCLCVGVKRMVCR